MPHRRLSARPSSSVLWSVLVTAILAGCGAGIVKPSAEGTDKEITHFAILGVDDIINGTRVSLTVLSRASRRPSPSPARA